MTEASQKQGLKRANIVYLNNFYGSVEMEKFIPTSKNPEAKKGNENIDSWIALICPLGFLAGALCSYYLFFQ